MFVPWRGADAFLDQLGAWVQPTRQHPGRHRKLALRLRLPLFCFWAPRTWRSRCEPSRAPRGRSRSPFSVPCMASFLCLRRIRRAARAPSNDASTLL